MDMHAANPVEAKAKSIAYWSEKRERTVPWSKTGTVSHTQVRKLETAPKHSTISSSRAMWGRAIKIKQESANCRMSARAAFAAPSVRDSIDTKRSFFSRILGSVTIRQRNAENEKGEDEQTHV